MTHPRIAVPDHLALRFANTVIALVLVVLAGGAGWNAHRNPQPQLVSPGIPLTAGLEAWVSRAPLPRSHPELTRQALLDLKALTLPSGAALAGRDGPWRFVWPRDSSFVVAAFCAAGFFEDATRVLDFLYAVSPATTGSDRTAGRWAARYLPDGSAPVRDGRGHQLDGSGWVPWSVHFCATRSPSGDDLARRFWPMVRQSADQIVTELRPDGLPAVSQDYWERDEKTITLGTVAPLLAGLRSAVDIANRIGFADAARWEDALHRLGSAVDREFGSRGFPRSRLAGPDAIVTVLGPPFAPARPDVTAAIERTRRALTVPNGGVTPGEDWRADGVAWTPQTMLFALSAAARGDRDTAGSILTWLDAHRTPLGSIPEKVNRHGDPAGEAPLGWTSALVVLTTTALDRPP